MRPTTPCISGARVGAFMGSHPPLPESLSARKAVRLLLPTHFNQIDGGPSGFSTRLNVFGPMRLPQTGFGKSETSVTTAIAKGRVAHGPLCMGTNACRGMS